MSLSRPLFSVSPENIFGICKFLEIKEEIFYLSRVFLLQTGNDASQSRRVHVLVDVADEFFFLKAQKLDHFVSKTGRMDFLQKFENWHDLEFYLGVIERQLVVFIVQPQVASRSKLKMISWKSFHLFFFLLDKFSHNSSKQPFFLVVDFCYCFVHVTKRNVNPRGKSNQLLIGN